MGQPPPYEYRWGWNIFQTPVLSGDYNSDDTVDAADYAVWRDNVGAPAGTLDNDIDGGPIGPEQYSTWRAYFRESAGEASVANAQVPEPATLVLLTMGVLAFIIRRSVS